MTYTVFRSNETDEFEHGKYATFIDAFKEAYALWWTYTTKSERQKHEVYIMANHEHDPETGYILVSFYHKLTVEKVLEIVEMYYEAYGFLPTEEVNQLAKFAEEKDSEYLSEIGTGYTSEEREASLIKACEIIGVELPTYDC